MTDGKREKQSFEPPPWEQAAFEELARKRAAEDEARAKAEAAETAAAEAEAAAAEVSEEPAAAPEAERAQVQAPPAAGGPAAGTRPPAVDEKKAQAMLLQLQFEEPATRKALSPIGQGFAIASGVAGMVFGGFGGYFLAKSNGQQFGTIGGGLTLLLAAFFIGIAAYTWFRSTQVKGS